MAKVTIDNLVSLIMEEIKNSTAPIFFHDFQDVVNYYDLGNENDAEVDQEEMGEMANTEREKRMENVEILNEPIRIPVESLMNGGSKPIPKIVSKDPDTGEFVEDVVIANMVITLPMGGQMVKFHNWGEKVGLDRKDMGTHYVKIPENIHFPNFPRSKKYGTEYVKSDKGVAKPDESPEEREARLKYITTQDEKYSKFYVIFPAVNKLFTTPDVLNRLDMCLVPEVRAGDKRTERTTNVEKRMTFGGTRPTINAEFHSVMDKQTIDTAIDYIFDVRAAVEDRDERERIISTFKPREYGGYRYPGGYWDAIQRIYDEAAFKQAGEYTPILKLLKKNIQKGQQGMNIISRLYIEGDIVDNEYVLRCKFSTILNYRTGDRETPVSAGKYTPDIFAETRKPVPEDVNPSDLTIRKNKDFFDDMFSQLMNDLGRNILTILDPDDAIDKLSKILVPDALDINALQ